MPRRRPVNATTHGQARNWVTGSAAGLVALAALVVGSQLGSLVKSATFHQKLISWVSAGVLLVSGVVGTALLSAALSRFVAHRSLPSAGGGVRILSAGVGYLAVIFAVFSLLAVHVEQLLVGAGLAGVVLGIAAQQTLGNVFAGLVLILARPFGLGDHIRIRSGALGGIFDARVDELSLTYVTLHTDDGVLKIPNAAMLAAGVYRLPPPVAHEEAGETDLPAPTDLPGSTDPGSTDLPGPVAL
jgi:small-conductance mechanosensitive channel